mmetsp:Transcript_133/g.1021  ORF Transcript_133/g.1021 Transcript_133/m.1021 type:complete len:354 (+) Transcript_133:3870-4931(+)
MDKTVLLTASLSSEDFRMVAAFSPTLLVPDWPEIGNEGKVEQLAKALSRPRRNACCNAVRASFTSLGRPSASSLTDRSKYTLICSIHGSPSTKPGSRTLKLPVPDQSGETKASYCHKSPAITPMRMANAEQASSAIARSSGMAAWGYGALIASPSDARAAAAPLRIAKVSSSSCRWAESHFSSSRSMRFWRTYLAASQTSSPSKLSSRVAHVSKLVEAGSRFVKNIDKKEAADLMSRLFEVNQSSLQAWSRSCTSLPWGTCETCSDASLNQANDELHVTAREKADFSQPLTCCSMSMMEDMVAPSATSFQARERFAQEGLGTGRLELQSSSSKDVSMEALSTDTFSKTSLHAN